MTRQQENDVATLKAFMSITRKGGRLSAEDRKIVGIIVERAPLSVRADARKVYSVMMAK